MAVRPVPGAAPGPSAAPEVRARPRRRAATALAILLGLVLALDQALQFTALADGRFLGRRVAPFDPPFFQPAQERYRERVAAIVAGDEELEARSLFDAELGWCPRPNSRWLESQYDWAAARIARAPLAREKPAGRRRIVAVGGSFTEGAEVQGTETWIAELELARPELELVNLGVSGFGLDQALLRFRRDGVPLSPDEVWFGLLPSATERATTLYPPAANHWSAVAAFKPRFRLGQDGLLQFVPLPVLDAAGTLRLLSDQQAFFDALVEGDDWIGAHPNAWRPRGTSWMHRSGLARIALTALEGRGRAPAALLDPHHPAFDLMTALLAELEGEACRHGALLRVVVLPARSDLRHALDHGQRYWSVLTESLVARGLAVFDATAALLAAGAADDDTAWRPEGHYAPRLNTLVAQALARFWND